MARLIINNKGIATVLAISIMIFIASIAVAVIPNINNLLKQNSLSADMLKAQMAAETGAKRAIAELYQGKDGENYNWTWLGTDKHLTGNNGSLYNVKQILNDFPLAYSWKITSKLKKFIYLFFIFWKILFCSFNLFDSSYFISNYL